MISLKQNNPLPSGTCGGFGVPGVLHTDVSLHHPLRFQITPPKTRVPKPALRAPSLHLCGLKDRAPPLTHLLRSPSPTLARVPRRAPLSRHPGRPILAVSRAACGPSTPHQRGYSKSQQGQQLLAGTQGSGSPRGARGTEAVRPSLQCDLAALLDLHPGVMTSYVIRYKVLSTNIHSSFTYNRPKVEKSQTSLNSRVVMSPTPHSTDWAALRGKAVDRWPHGKDTEHNASLCASYMLKTTVSLQGRLVVRARGLGWAECSSVTLEPVAPFCVARAVPAT